MSVAISITYYYCLIQYAYRSNQINIHQALVILIIPDYNYKY